MGERRKGRDRRFTVSARFRAVGRLIPPWLEATGRNYEKKISVVLMEGLLISFR